MPRLRAPTVVGVVAFVIDAAIVVVYVLALCSQAGPTNIARAVFISAYLVLLALMSVVGAVVPHLHARLTDDIFLGAGAGNIGLGLIALASIGAPLILAGLVLLAARSGWRGTLSLRSLAPPVAVLLALAVGMLVTG